MGGQETNDEQDQPSMESPYEFGLIFKSNQQEILYASLMWRVKGAHKFMDIKSLKDLHIYKGVHKILKNIGCEGVLNLHALSYQTPMLELLSSITFDYQTHILTFRLLNQSHKIHADILCDIIGAPKAERDVYTGKRIKCCIWAKLRKILEKHLL